MNKDVFVDQNQSRAQRKTAALDSPSDSEIPASVRTRTDAADGVDHQLIDKTKRQIQTLVSEIAELARSGCSATDFYEGFLNRTIAALASAGGAIWMDESGSGQLSLCYQVNLDATDLAHDDHAQQRHGLLLNKLWQAGEPALVPANSGLPDSDDGGNPTGNLLIVGPLKISDQTVGLVEIFQRTGAGPATQRGYVRFVTQMCELASNFLQHRKLESFEEQRNLWQQLDLFVTAIHQSLDPQQVAYIIANEGRRIIDSDRVSVALKSGGGCRIHSVSGLDSIERRSEQIKKLQILTAAVLKSNAPLWYNGNDDDLPPQIESRLHNYVDKSHSKMLAIIPLVNTPISTANESSHQIKYTVGALIVEQLKDSEISESLKKRSEVVASHSQIALANATEHHGLFLMPLWRSLGRMTRPLQGSRLPRTMIALALLAAVIAFFAWFPYPFTLSSNGQLQPIIQKEVFVKVDGVLKEVYVSDESLTAVQKDAPLAKMTNNELMVQIENLEGQIAQTKEQIRKFNFSQSKQLSNLDMIMLDGELLNAEVKLQSLQNELKIKQKQASELQILSPADGVVVNWQIRQHLLMRPVKRGQNLMTVVDPSGGWQVELDVPERRIGHLLDRIKDSGEPVQVEFTLVSHPGSQIQGTLEKIDATLDVYSDDGNCAKAIVRFDNSQIAPELLKSGTRIKARLLCGTRSIGYVWFHELFESAQMAYRYWF